MTIDYKGVKINVFKTHEISSAQAFIDERFEPAVIQASKILLKDLDKPIIFDIGANIGRYSLEIAQVIRETQGKIYAFEPQYTIFNQLCSNIIINRFENIYPIHAGLSKTAASISLPAYNYNTIRNTGAISLIEDVQKIKNMTLEKAHDFTSYVDTLVLDDFETEDKVDLIKMDVEGMESVILSGAHHFLKKNDYPPIIFEVWVEDFFKPSKEKLLHEFSELGYDLYLLESKSDYAAIYKTDHKTKEKFGVE